MEFMITGEDMKISVVPCTRHCAGSLYRARVDKSRRQVDERGCKGPRWQRGAREDFKEEVQIHWERCTHECIGWVVGDRRGDKRDGVERIHKEGILGMSKGPERYSLDVSGNVGSCR